MLTFVEYLMESSDEASGGTGNNGIASAFHEHAVRAAIIKQHYHGKENTMPASTKSALKDSESHMAKHKAEYIAAEGSTKGNSEINNQQNRAAHAAVGILKKAKDMGHITDKSHITDVVHTGASGITNYGDTKHNNPSDIVIHHNGPQKHLGVSLKSSKDGAIGFHNGGLTTVAKEAKADHIAKEAEDDRKSTLAKIIPGEGSQASKVAQIKALRKKNAAGEKLTPVEATQHAEIQKHAKRILGETSGKLADHYNKWAKDDHEGLKKHIQDVYLKHSPNNKLDHIKSTSYGEHENKKGFGEHTEHPDENPMNKAVEHATKFSFHRSAGGGDDGSSYVHVVAHQPDGTKRHVFSMQTKFNEEKVGTSLKVIGQPSTKKMTGECPEYTKG